MQHFSEKEPHYQSSILNVASIAAVPDMTTSISVIREMANATAPSGA